MLVDMKLILLQSDLKAFIPKKAWIRGDVRPKFGGFTIALPLLV